MNAGHVDVQSREATRSSVLTKLDHQIAVIPGGFVVGEELFSIVGVIVCVSPVPVSISSTVCLAVSVPLCGPPSVGCRCGLSSI